MKKKELSFDEQEKLFKAKVHKKYLKKKEIFEKAQEELIEFLKTKTFPFDENGLLEFDSEFCKKLDADLGDKLIYGALERVVMRDETPFFEGDLDLPNESFSLVLGVHGKVLKKYNLTMKKGKLVEKERACSADETGRVYTQAEAKRKARALRILRKILGKNQSDTNKKELKFDEAQKEFIEFLKTKTFPFHDEVLDEFFIKNAGKYKMDEDFEDKLIYKTLGFLVMTDDGLWDGDLDIDEKGVWKGNLDLPDDSFIVINSVPGRILIKYGLEMKDGRLVEARLKKRKRKK